MSVPNQNKQSKPGPRPNNLECGIGQISPAPWVGPTRDMQALQGHGELTAGPAKASSKSHQRGSGEDMEIASKPSLVFSKQRNRECCPKAAWKRGVS